MIAYLTLSSTMAGTAFALGVTIGMASWWWPR